MNTLERIFESMLWNSRLIVLVAVVSSLDDLKSRLAKVILLILIVKFFEHALSMHFSTSLDMLYFAGGIALIGLALYLSHSGEGHSTTKH